MSTNDKLNKQAKVAEVCNRAATDHLIKGTSQLRDAWEHYMEAVSLGEVALEAVQASLDLAKTDQERQEVLMCGEEISMAVRKNKAIYELLTKAGDISREITWPPKEIAKTEEVKPS